MADVGVKTPKVPDGPMTEDAALGWLIVSMVNDHFPHPSTRFEDDPGWDPVLGTGGCVTNCAACGALRWWSENPQRRAEADRKVRLTGYTEGWAFWDKRAGSLVWDWFAAFWDGHRSCSAVGGHPGGCDFGNDGRCPNCGRPDTECPVDLPEPGDGSRLEFESGTDVYGVWRDDETSRAAGYRGGEGGETWCLYSRSVPTTWVQLQKDFGACALALAVRLNPDPRDAGRHDLWPTTVYARTGVWPDTHRHPV